MIFHQIDAGGDRNFAYLLADKPGGTAALVDPPPNYKRFLSLIEQDDLNVEFVIVTHGHSDHTWGVPFALERFGSKLVAHESMHLKLDVPVADNDTLEVGDLSLRFIYTPGHCDDHICVLCDDKPGNDKLISGDILFVGKVGGTDLADGARREYDSLHQKLMTLPPETEVWPGHDFGSAPSSTIGHELETNPFILCNSFEAFVDLKVNWLQYKRDHGIK
jgi:hydroxyacylglutathione hydrolase